MDYIAVLIKYYVSIKYWQTVQETVAAMWRN